MDRFVVKDEGFENKVKIENSNSATINNINIVREKESDLNFDLIADQSKISNHLTQEIIDTDISDDDFNDLNLNKNNNNIISKNNNILNQDNNILNRDNNSVNPNNNNLFLMESPPNLENNNINIINTPLDQKNIIPLYNSPVIENNDMGKKTDYFNLNLDNQSPRPEDIFKNDNNLKTPEDFMNFNLDNQEPINNFINNNSPINYNQASPPINNNKDSHPVRNIEEEKNYQARQPLIEKKTQEEIYKEKRDILFKLKRLKKKGVNVPKFTVDSDIEIMKEELESIERELSMDSSVQFYSNGLTFLCSLIEFGNDKMEFGLNFKHLTAHIEDQKSQFIPIFEELYEKYQDTPAMPPEIKLVATFGFCLFTYHLTNSQTQNNSPMKSMFSNVMGATQAKPEKPQTFSERMNDRIDKRTKPHEEPMDRNMSGPTGVEDILAEIQKEKEKYKNNDNVSESGGSGDSYSIISGSEFGTKKKVRRRKTKKPEFDLNL